MAEAIYSRTEFSLTMLWMIKYCNDSSFLPVKGTSTVFSTTSQFYNQKQPKIVFLGIANTLFNIKDTLIYLLKYWGLDICYNLKCKEL